MSEHLGFVALDQPTPSAAFVDFLPSEREQRLGAPAPEVEDSGLDQVAVVQPRKRGSILAAAMAPVKSSARALDPRGIAEPGNRLPLIIFALLGTVGTFDNAGFGLILIFIKVDLNFDFAIYSTLTVMVTVALTLFSPLGGYLADRISRVWMVRVGALLTHAPVLAIAMSHSAAPIMGARIVGGLGTALFVTAQLPLVADYYPVERRLRAFSFLGLGGLLGASVGVLLCLVAMLNFGVSWRVLLLATGSFSVLLSLSLFLLREPVRGAVDRRSLGLAEEDVAKAPPPVPFGEALRVCRSIGTLRRLWVATPFISIALTGVGSFLFFVIQQRFAKGEIGGPGADLLGSPYALYIFTLGPAFLSVIGLAVATPVADRLMRVRPERVMVLVGSVLAVEAVGFLLYVVSPLFVLSIAINSVISGLAQIIPVGQNVVLSTVVPARVRGLGFQTIAPFQLAGLAMVPVIGGLADNYGPVAVIYLLIPLFLLGAVITASAGRMFPRDIRSALASSAADEATAAARRAGGNKMILCRSLEVAYGGTRILAGVDLDIDEGELIAILGSNGAGKSTLLRAIAGLHEASAGAVFLDGADITHRPAHANARDRLVFLPGGRAIFPTLTVADNLRIAAAQAVSADGGAAQERIDGVLALFPELRERFSVQAGDLSGGEQQMLALCQSFLMRPRLLMIDELSLGLAPAVVQRLLDIVRRIHDQGTTVVLVEQSVNVALTIARRAIFMERGEIRFDGSVEALMRRDDLLASIHLAGAASAVTRVGAGRRQALRERILSVEDVQARYGGVVAVSDVSVEVHAGEVVGIIGPNGAGKTTLFDVISGYLPAERGVVMLRAHDVTDAAPDARARLGMARSFQDARLFRALTVRETIMVAVGKAHSVHSALLASVWAPQVRRSERRVRRRTENLLETFSLQGSADKLTADLSTGQRRLLDFACVVAGEPSLLLLDEPSSGLAQAEVEMLAPVVRRVVSETSCAVLVIEHDMPLITAMADALVAMDLGRVIARGTPAEVLDDAAVRAAYLSASEGVLRRSGVAVVGASA
jgi:ABC-type branched-subunit amino acid transport system ATPase component